MSLAAYDWGKKQMQSIKKSVQTKFRDKRRGDSTTRSTVLVAGRTEKSENSSALGDQGVSLRQESRPIFELAGNQRDWIIEHQQDTAEPIKVEEPLMKQNVCIRFCENTKVHVAKKVNNMVLENCRNVTLVVNCVISTIELIRVEKCDIQILGRACAVSLDQCTEVNIYAGAESRDIQLTTAQISHINLHVPDHENADEWIELPVPAQFVHQVNTKSNSLNSKVSDLYG